MKIENMPLFTEYERQFNRKYPVFASKTDINNGGAKFLFEFIKDNHSYSFMMTANEPAKNGTITCSLALLSTKVDGPKYVTFDESRKPMEMNVDNLITVAKFMLKEGEAE